MYQFRDLEPKTAQNSPLSSVAITIGGKQLDGVLEGFRTLNVEGRELLGSSLSFYDGIPGRDGAWIKEETLPYRTLTVHYLLEAKTNQEYRAKFNQLNALLREGGRIDKKIIFADEADCYFMGRLAEASTPDPSSNIARGTFALLCQDPYKYGGLETVTGRPAMAPQGAYYPFFIEKIKATIPSAATKAVVKNETSGKRIILDSNFSAGQVLEILPEKILLAGQNIMSKLNYLESDWHQFEISSGDTISITPSANVELTLRRRFL